MEALVLTGEREDRELSLGHDALAPVAAAWDEEVQAGVRVRQAFVQGMLLATGALVLIAALSLAMMKVAEQISMSELVTHSRLASALTADFAADKVYWKVRRYKVLLEEARKDENMRNWLRHPDAPGARANLQQWAETRAKRFAVAERRAWAVVDAHGVQLANSLRPDLRGGDFSWRSYFHGQEKDLTPQQSKTMVATKRPFLSPVFTPVGEQNGREDRSATIDQTPRVALSVPIWDGEQGGSVLGVLVVTLDPRQFLELPPSIEDQNRLVVFTDQQGARVSQCGDCPADRPIDPSILAKLREGTAKVGDLGEDPKEIWIAAERPIDIDRNPKIGSGWSVIVAAREREVTDPLRRLRFRVLLNGIVAMILVLIFLAVMIPLLAWRLHPSALNIFRKKVEKLKSRGGA